MTRQGSNWNLEPCSVHDLRQTKSNTRRVLTLFTVSAAQIHINRWSHSLGTDSPQIHGYAQQNSAGVTTSPHFRLLMVLHENVHFHQLCMVLHGSCQVSAPSSSQYSMVADKLPHHLTVLVLSTGTPHQNSMDAGCAPFHFSMGLLGCWLCSVPLLHGTPWMLAVLRSTHTNVADKNRNYTSFHHVSREDQNCAVLKACREHHETRQDVVSGQTEENSARNLEDVLRVGGFRHKNRASSSVGKKTIKQRSMLASSLGCGRSDQSRLTFSLSGS